MDRVVPFGLPTGSVMESILIALWLVGLAEPYDWLVAHTGIEPAIRPTIVVADDPSVCGEAIGCYRDNVINVDASACRDAPRPDACVKVILAHEAGHHLCTHAPGRCRGEDDHDTIDGWVMDYVADLRLRWMIESLEW